MGNVYIAYNNNNNDNQSLMALNEDSAEKKPKSAKKKVCTEYSWVDCGPVSVCEMKAVRNRRISIANIVDIAGLVVVIYIQSRKNSSQRGSSGRRPSSVSNAYTHIIIIIIYDPVAVF